MLHVTGWGLAGTKMQSIVCFHFQIGMSKITFWIVWSGLYPHPVWLFPSLSLRAEAVIWLCLLLLLPWQSPFLLQASVLIPKILLNTELLSYWSSGHKSQISRRNKAIWDICLSIGSWCCCYCFLLWLAYCVHGVIAIKRWCLWLQGFLGFHCKTSIAWTLYFLGA